VRACEERAPIRLLPEWIGGPSGLPVGSTAGFHGGSPGPDGRPPPTEVCPFTEAGIFEHGRRAMASAPEVFGFTCESLRRFNAMSVVLILLLLLLLAAAIGGGILVSKLLWLLLIVALVVLVVGLFTGRTA
jgi:hypothetical protein